MEPGRVVAGKYRLQRELGRGGMGAVWAAVHETLGRTVAVKFLEPRNQDPTLAERFVSEARMVASIKHRFVVDVFDFGVTSEDGLYYMVLELLEGSALAKHMDSGPALTVREGVQLIADCLRGLDAVHAAGIVHRDLKPENIFVIHDSDGYFPKLIDFGISKRAEEIKPNVAPEQPGSSGRRSRLTAPGMLVGTQWYMPPEQLRGRGDVDGRADVYGMAVILYELLVGGLPYPQDNVGDLMVAIVGRAAAPVAKLRPELGTALSDVIVRAMSPEPADRFPNALAMRAALLAALPSLPENATTIAQQHVPPAQAERGDRTYGKLTELQFEAAGDPFALTPNQAARAKPARARWIGIAAAAMLVLVGLALWLGHDSTPSSQPSGSTNANASSQPAAHEPAPAPSALPRASAERPVTVRPGAPPPTAATSGEQAHSPVQATASATPKKPPAAATQPAGAAASSARPRATTSASSPARKTQTSAAPPKKLFKKLDF